MELVKNLKVKISEYSKYQKSFDQILSKSPKMWNKKENNK